MNLKLSTLFVLALFTFSNAFGQGTNKLIAHWDFNGSANDVSGNGLNGTATGTTMAVGYNGIANTAYQFNGTSDGIDVAYNSLMDLDSYSICILIKPLGYYSGECQVNSLLSRGTEWNSGPSDYYRLMFSDNAYDNGDCNNYSPNNEVFMPTEHSNNMPPNSAWYAGSTLIDLGVWYCAVTTYDGDTLKIYVNGALVKVIGIPDAYVPGLDPISIAYQQADSAAGYPYFYNGSIDDIKLYGRALSATEAGQYCDSAKAVDTGGHTVDTSGHSSGVSNIQIAPTIVITPNPTHNNFVIKISGDTNEGYIELVNSVGQLITEKQIDNKEMEMNLENLPAGLYMVRVKVNNQLIVNKVIKE